MRIRYAARFGVLIVLALVLSAMLAAPVAARGRKAQPTHTCAEVWGTDHVWDTDKGTGSYGLTLDPDDRTACVDLTTAGGDFTVTFTNDGARVQAYYASVRDSVPGSFCGEVSWNASGDVATISGVPASGMDACGEAVRYPDTDPQLALYVGADIRGKGGSVDVTITYQPTAP